MKIATFKDKSRILPMLTFIHSNLNILSYIISFDKNLIFLYSWLKGLLAYQISIENELIWERYDIYKMTHEFCQQTSFVKKQVPKHPNQHPVEVFMDDFMVYDDSFDMFLENLSLILKRCIETNLVLNYKKCCFSSIRTSSWACCVFAWIRGW